MSVYQEGTIVVLRNFMGKKTTLLGVVLGYVTGADVNELVKDGFVVFDEDEPIPPFPNVVKIRPYDQDKWREWLKAEKVQVREFCYVALTDNAEANKFYAPYLYQFEDLVVFKKDNAGEVYKIIQIGWVGEYSVQSNKRLSVNPNVRGTKIKLQPTIGIGIGLNVSQQELETKFDLYE